MLKLVLKLRRELQLTITIEVSILLGIYLFSNFPPLVHEEFGLAFAWMGNLAALKAKLLEISYVRIEIWLSEV